MISRALLFIISLILAQSSYSQILGIEAVRVGVDPVRSFSFLLNNKKKDQMYVPHVTELYSEFLIFERTSFIAELGYSNNYFQTQGENLHYTSKGIYSKLGFDFDLTAPEEKVNFSIGWRAGFNHYSERQQVNLISNYYHDSYIINYHVNTKNFIWGELLITHKYKLYENYQTKNKLYFSFSLRCKFTNHLPGKDYPSLAIPGYGFYHKYVPGITFGLLYHFQIKRNTFKELKRRRIHNQNIRKGY